MPECSNNLIDPMFSETGLCPKEIYHNESVPFLYENALRYELGTSIVSSGSLSTLSGEKTGRSPKDKRIVKEESTEKDIWWGKVNIPMDEHTFEINRKRAIDYLNLCYRMYVVDGYAGWDRKHRIKIRIICSRAYHALFMYNMLVRPTNEELSEFKSPDFIVYNAGDFPANTYTTGMNSGTSVDINFKKGEMVILGTNYAGEMKKGIFTIINYLMPKIGILSLHSSCNESIVDDKNVTVFFGLSGTGKTTLSAESSRRLIGDDEHCWSDDGIFNVEGGCYAKCINLSKEFEPEIFDAIRFGSILENVVYDSNTRVVDFSNKGITENTRCAYPIEFIQRSKIPCITTHPTNIIMLTCDAFGVLPPVAKLTVDQAMYYFISGYTAKIPGTEIGVETITATFSACFGEPFMVWNPEKYTEMLGEKIRKHNPNIWLINTGWVGGPYGVGKRISIKTTREIIQSIHNNSILNSSYFNFPIFNLSVPMTCPNTDSKLFNPENNWNNINEYNVALENLATLFIKNFSSLTIEHLSYLSTHGPQI